MIRWLPARRAFRPRSRARRWLQDRLVRLGHRLGATPGRDQSMWTPRTREGDWVNLVHGECVECGWRMAGTEGAMWPYCPNCGIRVLPPEGRFFKDVTDPNEIRYGYAARFDEEWRIIRDDGTDDDDLSGGLLRRLRELERESA